MTAPSLIHGSPGTHGSMAPLLALHRWIDSSAPGYPPPAPLSAEQIGAVIDWLFTLQAAQRLREHYGTD